MAWLMLLPWRDSQVISIAWLTGFCHGVARRFLASHGMEVVAMAQRLSASHGMEVVAMEWLTGCRDHMA
jgi:hypothetical protein